MPKRFLIMAGGTGGHVFPALATAKQLMAQGCEVQWLGSVGGMEEHLVREHKIPISLIAVSGLRGKNKLTLIAAPLKLAKALFQARAVISHSQIDCVIGMGGFVSGPGGLAAWMLKKPLVIHEQNAIAGMTNRILARFAKTVLEAFPNSFGAGVVTRLTGNPVRPEVARILPPVERLAGREGPLHLLVLGGSLGAKAINECLPQVLARMAVDQRPTVRHQAGERHQLQTAETYEAKGVDAEVVAFIDDMSEAYAWADLVICRSGALTIAELCAAGVGAILVPFPHAVDDHQTRNARFMVDGGAAMMVGQSELQPESIVAVLRDLADDRPRLLKMAEAARKLARPDATERVVNYCLEAANA